MGERRRAGALPEHQHSRGGVWRRLPHERILHHVPRKRTTSLSHVLLGPAAKRLRLGPHACGQQRCGDAIWDDFCRASFAQDDRTAFPRNSDLDYHLRPEVIVGQFELRRPQPNRPTAGCGGTR